MADEITTDKRKTNKSQLRQGRHTSRSSTRLNKHSRGNSSRSVHLDVGELKPLTGPDSAVALAGSRKPKKHSKKPVIQLEHSESDENDDFVDVDEEPSQQSSPQSTPVSSKTLEDGLVVHPVIPVPPQTSNETVVSVSDVSTARTRSQQNGFVDNQDLLSSAMSSMHGTEELTRIFGSTMRSSQQSRRFMQLTEPKGEAKNNSEIRRLYERVLREYLNCKSVNNPVISSVERVGEVLGTTVDTEAALNGSPIQRSQRSLTATTIKEIDSDSDATKNYLLNKLWTDGWKDPDMPSEPVGSAESIRTQARKVQQRFVNGNKRTSDASIKLA